jgi:glycopeptide antibiotics resistance protein
MRNINWLLIGYCFMILVLSVVTINGSGSLIKIKLLGLRSDYLLHLLLFIPWMMLARWRWPDRNGLGFNQFAIVAGLLLATISEGVQYFLPYRTFNVYDLLSNCVGLMIGGLISWKMMRLGVISERQ